MTARRIDNNHRQIVAELRKLGATVQSLAKVGCGCPDILVGFRRKSYVFEIKTPDGTLTPDERDWHDKWAGQVAVIRSAEDALTVMTEEG